MLRAPCVVVMLLVSIAHAFPPSFLTTYRDGDTRPPRVMTALTYKGWVARHAASGDIDKTCDGVCRVVVCECAPTELDPEPMRMCGGSLAGCTAKVLEIPVGSTRGWDHQVIRTTLACEPSRPKVCASSTGQ